MKKRQIGGCFLMGLAVFLSVGGWLLWPRSKPLPPPRQGTLHSTGIGLIDSSGQPVSETFDEVGEATGDYAPYREGGYWGLLPSLQPQFEELRAPQEGLVAVRADGLWGFVDVNGVERIAPQYEAVGDFSGGRAAVKLNGNWGFVDDQGKVVVPLQYDGAGLFPRVREMKDWEFLGLQGHFQDARDFHEDRAAVEREGSWGYLDRQGALAIPCQFEAAADFAEGKAAVRKGGQWGYIDLRDFCHCPSLAGAEPFSEGMAAVQVGDQWQYVDVAGKTLWQLPAGISEPGPFRGGLARATWQAKAAYLDRNGRQVWPPSK